MKHKLFFTSALCHLTFYMAFTQDIHFTQFTQTPLTINPAQAGTTAHIRGAMGYRSQWSSITNPYSTLAASFDVKTRKRWGRQKTSAVGRNRTLLFQKVSETGLGWGINIFNDKAGTSKMGTLQANLALAYQLKTSDHTMLAAGLQGGIVQRSIRYDALKWGNQYNGSNYDPNLSSQEDFSTSSLIYPDFGTGILWTYKKSERYMRGNDQKDVYIGASLSHLTQPAYSFFGTDEKLYRKLIIHGHSLIGIKNTNYSLTPSLMYARQGSARELLVGTLIRYMLKEDSKYTGYVKGSTIAIGGYYRNKDALMVAALFEMSQYAIGISYDINVSKLRTVSYGRGGFEITLRFLNPSPFLFSQASFSK